MRGNSGGVPDERGAVGEVVRAYLAPIIKNRQYNFLPFGENFFVGAQARPNEITYSEDWMRPDYNPAASAPPVAPPPAAPPPAGPLPAEAPAPVAPLAAEAGAPPQAAPPAPTEPVATDPAAGLPGMMVPHGAGS